MYLTMSRQRLAGETFPPFGISGREGTEEGVDASGPNGTASIQLGFLFPAWIFISVGNKILVPKCKNIKGNGNSSDENGPGEVRATQKSWRPQATSTLQSCDQYGRVDF